MGFCFLCNQHDSMIVSKCQAAELFLQPSVVININVIGYGVVQFFAGVKGSQIVHLTLEATPESLHRAVVNATPYAGHALGYLCLVQFTSKNRQL